VPEQDRQGISFEGLASTSGHAFVKLPKSQPAHAKIPAYLGVFIYAYARSYMWTTIFYHTHYIYTDTDSAVIPREHLMRLQQAGLIGDDKTSRLGLFKAEGEYDTFYIVAPKMYLLYNSKSKQMQARCKGIGRSDMFTDVTGTDLKYEGNELIFFKQLLDKGVITVKTFQFRKDMKSSTWKHVPVTKIIRVRDDTV